MAKVRLTDRGLKALKPKAQPYDVMDDSPRAFGVRVRPTGKLVFILYRRFPGGSNKPTRRPKSALSRHDAGASSRRCPRLAFQDPPRHRPGR